jgi:asparagine synthase (glutamine-hydrolysing)
MCDAIVHRGPDDQGQFVAGPVGIGMRRLSIIDIGGGHQPMQNEDGSLTVVFNGEIYNYRELRADLEVRGYRFRTASDTESILHAYAEHGPDCLSLLNGMFALALWDAKQQRLFVARDRLGIKPLYIAETPAGLRFASEMKALLTNRDLSRDLDRDALTYFLKYGYVSPPATLLRSVRKLRPGHYLLADRNGTQTRSYWSLQYQEGAGSEPEHAEALYDALRKAVRRQLVADVPLGAFLSGGLDSSSIVHLMSEITGAQVNTYSIGFGGADAFHSELADARRMADRSRTNHHEILVQPDVAGLIPKLVYHLDEPLADSSFVVTYLVSTLAAQTVKVILSGVGGDELFGGYRRYLGPRLSPYYQRVPGPLRQGLKAASAMLPVDRGSYVRNLFRLGRAFVQSQELPPFSQYDQAVRLISDPLLRRISPVAVSGETSLDEARRGWFDGVETRDDVTRMMHLDLNTSLVESLLMLTDKMTMATSIEARVPFLDHEVVELAARIPSRFKIHGTQLRHVQKAAMRGHLPDDVLTKRKRGFGFTIGAWFRRELREMTRDLLLPARIARRGVFDSQVVGELIDAHEHQREDYSDALLALLTFELWHEQAIAS